MTGTNYFIAVSHEFGREDFSRVSSQSMAQTVIFQTPNSTENFMENENIK